MNFRSVSPESLARTRRHLKSFFGDDVCPCLPLESLPPPPQTVKDLDGNIVNGLDFDIYGLGCASHDLENSYCQEEKKPPWCQLSWCWVDQDNCSLLARKSRVFEERWYSYATCRNMDYYSGEERISSLANSTLRIALTHNTAGWYGSKSKYKTDFNGKLEDWSGPPVDFIKIAAEASNMTIEIMHDIPFEIIEKGKAFFQSTSNFDACVFAATIGITDMCVAAFSVSSKRAASSKFIILGSSPVKLIIQEDFFSVTDPRLYWESIKTIFQPFTGETWAFLAIFVLPLFGMIILVNEYGVTGSVFPREEVIVDAFIDDDDLQKVQVKKRKVPLLSYCFKVVITMFFSILKGTYIQPIVSSGGQFTLLGIGFLILTIIAVYTANLSALLVAEARFGRVETLQAIINRGHRFCARRSVMEDAISIYDIDESMFVVDPVHEGGDGKPGFSCTNCNQGQRVFDFLDSTLASKEMPGPNATYCHAALAVEEDLQAFQALGLHCNKSIVGQTLFDQYWGYPVYDGINKEMSALILKLKIENELSRILRDATPSGQCLGDFVTVADETSTLNIVQLLGIWVATFGLSIIALAFTCISPMLKKRRLKRMGRGHHVIYVFDQTGQRINRLEDGNNDFQSSLITDHVQLSRSSSYRSGYLSSILGKLSKEVK
jgi:hypothetical protein